MVATTNPAIETILTRRSVRAYTKEQIRDEDLRLILKCALYAPSGANLQHPRFLVMQSPALLEELNTVIRDELAHREAVEGRIMSKGILRARGDGYHFIYHAPTLITAVAPRSYENSMADCACALENIQLATVALGLGGCWSNQTHWLTGVSAVREFFNRLGLREDEDIFGSVAVGYPGRVPMAAPRKEGRVEFDTTSIQGGGDSVSGS